MILSVRMLKWQMQKRQCSLLGNSVVKKVNGFLLTRHINHKYLVKVRPFSSAKLSCINDHMKPMLQDFNLEHITLHIGIDTGRTTSQILKSIINLYQSLKTDANTMAVSLIVPRYNNLNN